MDPQAVRDQTARAGVAGNRQTNIKQIAAGQITSTLCHGDGARRVVVEGMREGIKARGGQSSSNFRCGIRRAWLWGIRSIHDPGGAESSSFVGGRVNCRIFSGGGGWYWYFKTEPIPKKLASLDGFTFFAQGQPAEGVGEHRAV